MDAASLHPELLNTLLALAAISIASVLGSISFALGRRLEAALPYLVAIASGTLLGTALAHLLPESVEHLGSVRRVGVLLLAGLLGSFLLERILMLASDRFSSSGGTEIRGTAAADFHYAHEHERRSGRPLVANILLSGAVHSFLDGVAIAVAFTTSHQAGMATTIAVFLHEVPHHVADVSVLIYAGMGRRRATVLNLLATSGCAVGGVLVLVSGLRSAEFTYTLLPIAAASFLYLGLAILIPEFQAARLGKRAFVQALGLVGAALLMAALSRWTPE